MHQHPGGAGRLQADHNRELVVVDLDALAGVLGHIAVGRDDHDNRLADVFDHLTSQAVGRHRVGQAGVGDQQRKAFSGLSVEVFVGVDRDDTRDLYRGRHVDVQDAGVRKGTADEGSGERALAEVVQITAVPGHQARVLPALDGRTEHLGRHAPAPRSLEISAARRTDLTMFWYPVQRQRLPEIASRASASVGSWFSSRYAVMVVRKPGVQNPHCSPWHSMKACCTGLIVDAPVPSTEPASPSTVVISWSWAVMANIRQERIGVPSIKTVQAPHTPCSHPTWVPVSRSSCRRKSDNSLRAGAIAVCATPLTRIAISSNGSATSGVISLTDISLTDISL